MVALASARLGRIAPAAGKSLNPARSVDRDRVRPGRATGVRAL
jgi:hypothetical protein